MLICVESERRYLPAEVTRSRPTSHAQLQPLYRHTLGLSSPVTLRYCVGPEFTSSQPAVSLPRVNLISLGILHRTLLTDALVKTHEPFLMDSFLKCKLRRHHSRWRNLSVSFGHYDPDLKFVDLWHPLMHRDSCAIMCLTACELLIRSTAVCFNADTSPPSGPRI